MMLTSRLDKAINKCWSTGSNPPRAEEYVAELCDAILEDEAVMGVLIERLEAQMAARTAEPEAEEPEGRGWRDIAESIDWGRVYRPYTWPGPMVYWNLKPWR